MVLPFLIRLLISTSTISPVFTLCQLCTLPPTTSPVNQSMTLSFFLYLLPSGKPLFSHPYNENITQIAGVFHALIHHPQGGFKHIQTKTHTIVFEKVTSGWIIAIHMGNKSVSAVRNHDLAKVQEQSKHRRTYIHIEKSKPSEVIRALTFLTQHELILHR